MKIVEETFIMNNLVIYQAEYELENFDEGFQKLASLELNDGLYQNGPLFFSTDHELKEQGKMPFTYYMPICWEIDTSNNSIDFEEILLLPRTLMVRQADQEEGLELVIEAIKNYAEENQLTLSDKVFCVITPIYGEQIMDVYIEIID